MTKEVLRQALEVMRNQGDVSVDEWIATEKAIEEALKEDDDLTIAYMAGLSRGKDIAKQKPLTDDDIQDIAYEGVANNWDWLQFARAIESSHGIK